MENARPISLAELMKSRRAATNTTANKIMFGTTLAGNYKRCQLHIGEFYSSELGWMPGDKVDLLYFDEDKMVIMKRVEKDKPGFNLTQSGKCEGRLKLSFVWQEPIPYHKGIVEMEGVEVRKDNKTHQQSLYFNIPDHFLFYDYGLSD